MRKRALTIDLHPWPFDEGPRVLIEHPDPDRGLELATAIRTAGFAVGVCTGPGTAHGRKRRCPLHRLQPCVAVEGADAVVTALDLETEEGRGVLHGLRLRYPSVPVVALATLGETLELGDLLDGCTVVPVDADGKQVSAAVVDALPSSISQETR